MVSPLSFRDPVFTARMGKDVDDLSGGRLILGVGAGWQEHEHSKFGFDLLEPKPRFDRFDEGVEVIYHLLKDEDPVSFTGEYYNLNEAVLLPRPARAGGPPLLIGGRGWNRTLPLAARFADEWNCGFRPVDEFVKLNARLNTLLEGEARRPEQVRRSLVNVTVFGRDEADLAQKLEQRGYSEEGIKEFGMIVGTAPQIADRVREYGDAGVERVLLQWLELDDIEGLEMLAKELL
jgi:alkanesulfonate monooxygenase SsuD/methylene tetrahydromethanopterin reductase-like flavin-dependent oxidoreductase (luciferase family)